MAYNSIEEIPDSPPKQASNELPTESRQSSSPGGADSTPPPPTPSSSSNKAVNGGDDDNSRELTNDEDEDDDDGGEGDDSVWYTPSELRDILDRSNKLKQDGNTLFGKGRWEAAMESYKEGLGELPVRTAPKRPDGKGKDVAEDGSKDIEDEEDLVAKAETLNIKEMETNSEEQKEETEEEGEARELRAVLLANVAACFIKLERWKEAVQACTDALEDNPVYAKAFSRRAMASERIGSWSSLSSALSDHKTILTLPSSVVPLPISQSATQALKRLPPLIEVQQQKEKDEVMGKLKDLGNTVLGKFGLSTDNFKFVQQPGGGYSMNFER
ncbi:hypothetical protein T439DRAFT_329882 [Meredithblackwellia eburnea MCA 4105]